MTTTAIHLPRHGLPRPHPPHHRLLATLQGRIFKQASEAEPKNGEARRLAKMSKWLVGLDAHVVSNTEELLKGGQCHYFYGQQLDGHPCDKRRYKYE